MWPERRGRLRGLSGPVRSAFCGGARKPAHPVLNKPRNPKRQPSPLVAVCAHHVEEPFFNQRPMSGSPRVAPGIINSESVSTARRLHAYACPRIIAGLLGYFPGRANWAPCHATPSGLPKVPAPLVGASLPMWSWERGLRMARSLAEAVLRLLGTRAHLASGLIVGVAELSTGVSASLSICKNSLHSKDLNSLLSCCMCFS